MEALLPGLIGVIYLHTFKKLLIYQPKISTQQRADHVRFWPERVLRTFFYEVHDGVRVRELAARASAGLPYAFARSSPGSMTRPLPAKRRFAREAFCCPSLRRRLGRYETAGRPRPSARTAHV